MKKQEKLEKLEKEFKLAAGLVEDFDEITLEVESSIVELQPTVPTTEVVTGELVPVTDEEIFSLTLLKQDFLMVRQNLLGLVAKGQRLMDVVNSLEITDVRGAQLEGMASLNNSILSGLKDLIGLYKTIIEIEVLKKKGTPAALTDGPVNMGTVNTTNNIIFNGTPNELLNMIKENS